MNVQRDYGSQPGAAESGGWREELRQGFADLAAWGATDAPVAFRLVIRGPSVTAHADTSAGSDVLGHADTTRAQSVAALAAIVKAHADAAGVAPDVTLSFSADQVFHLPLDLPRAPAATLRRAAILELERLNPLPASALYIDTCIVQGADRAHVDLHAIRRAIVDETIAQCRRAGLAVGGVAFEDDGREARWRSFPVDRAALGRRLWRRHGTQLLAGLAVALFAGLLCAVYLREAETAAQLDAQDDALSARAAEVHRLAHDIRDMRTQFAFAGAQRRMPLAIDILNRLSAALPDGTWLTQMEIKGTQVHIEGFSKSAPAIIAAIDQVPGFAEAQFAAPLEGAQDGAEHFDLTFTTKGGRAP